MTQAIISSAALSSQTTCIITLRSATRLSSTSQLLSNRTWNSEWPVRVKIRSLAVEMLFRPLELLRAFLIPAEESSSETHRPWSPSLRWVERPTMALLQQLAQVIGIKRRKGYPASMLRKTPPKVPCDLSTVSCRITSLRRTKAMFWI